jgi:hypothetical protein
MKKIMMTLVMTACSFCVSADTALVFGFDTTDSGADVDGIEYNSTKQTITFSGAVNLTGQTLWDQLDGVSGQVNFFIGAVGDLAGLSGTLTPVGGNINIGGYGGAVDSTTAAQFDSGEAWTFTFSSDVILNAVRYYGEDPAGQTILTNNVAVAGSPFTSDFSGAGIFVTAGDSLTFGQAGSGTYALQDFTITVVPEPSAMSMLGLGGVLAFLIRRMSRT